MIELPTFAVPGSFQAFFMDAGFTQRGVQSLDRIDRKGGRYKLALSYGPYLPDQARIMVSRLIAAKQSGLRVDFPLLHDQGGFGPVRLNAAVTSGRTIQIKDLGAGYVIEDGFWLSLVKGTRHYLHNVRFGGTANGSGIVTVELNELLRDTFAENTMVHLGIPKIEGLVDGDEYAWAAAVDRVTPIEFTIEEVR